MTDNCPPDCQVKLLNIDKQLVDLKEMDTKQWEVFDQKIVTMEAKVSERVKTRTLIALFGILVTVFLAIMALTFSTLSNGQQQTVQKLEKFHTQSTIQMNKIERQMVKVETELENHTNRHERDGTN